MLPHKSRTRKKSYNLTGYRALVITTSYSTLDTIDKHTGKVIKVGGETGVYASEFTEPYYAFLDAKMEVDIVSISGGKIPIEKLSLRPGIRTKDDVRFLNDPMLLKKVKQSFSINEVDFLRYDIVFLAGGWGAAYDFAQSQILADKISEAYRSKKVLGAVCHGPLGFIGAQKPDGSPLVKGVKLTGVTNRQLKQLFVANTPKHPETELKNAGAHYVSESGWIDMFKSHCEIDENHLIVTGQNQKCAKETAQNAMELLLKSKHI